MSKDKKVRTRFAPSPTGDLHVGSLRTALYSYALAKHFGGDFILRIEDTDKKREVEGSKDKLKDNLKMFGLDWDEYYEQSNRVETKIYEDSAKKMVSEGKAFYCQCKAKNAKSEGYSKELRDPCRDKNLSEGAIKLKVPENEIISFRDYVLDKEISWNTSDISDTTLLKTDGFPTYHLAVVVDDNDMRITHALRGHDWMPSTPIHLLVYKYLGYEVPEIGHLTDILDPEGGKLSKRKGSTTVEALLKDGYLPSAILNFVMLLGWAPKDNTEMFSLDDFVKKFTPDGFQKSNPIYNTKKLDWFNGEYIRLSEDDKLVDTVYEYYNGEYKKDDLLKIVPIVKERIRSLKEFKNLTKFFFEDVEVDKSFFEQGFEEQLKEAYGVLEKVTQWNEENINRCLIALVNEKQYKTGVFFMNLRIAITGSKVTPPINQSLVILGKEKTLRCLSNFK